MNAMRDYGKVFSRIWESSDFRALSEDGRMLSLYLLTCPHGTIAGVFRVPDGYACEDLQWSRERVRKGFAELSAKGFANRCEATNWVWIVKFLEWNPPENPNQRKSAAKIVSGAPENCAWKPDFMRRCGQILGFDLPEQDGESGTLKEPFGNGSLTSNSNSNSNSNTSSSLRSEDVGTERDFDDAGTVDAASGSDPTPEDVGRLAIKSPLDDVPAKLLADYRKVRTAKRAGPLTETAVAGLVREAGKAGISLTEAITACCEYSWQGFRADWWVGRQASAQQQQRGALAPAGGKFSGAARAIFGEPAHGEVIDV